MGRFDPHDLRANEALFDEALQTYLEVYHAAGIEPKHYENVEAFAADYLK